MSIVGLRVIGLAGAIFFGILAAVLALRPDFVERRAHSWVVERVAREAAAALNRGGEAAGSAGGYANVFSAGADAIVARFEAGLAADLARRLEAACHYCKQDDSVETRAASIGGPGAEMLELARATAMEWAGDRYSTTVVQLVRDLRIFTSVNAVLFLLVFGASFTAKYGSSPAASVTLWLLLGATFIGVLGYVFVQDWFYTLLTGRFIGYGYGLWVTAVFVALWDWTLNRARASEAVMNVVGGAFSGGS
jgi:hypothetical protein